jgi:hypothetical protein
MAKYGLMVLYKNGTLKEDIEFVHTFLVKHNYGIAYGGYGNTFLYHSKDDGAGPLIAISGRIPESVMRHINFIHVMRITEIVDVTQTIGVNNICR